MQTSTVIEYSPMDPYSGSYHQPPMDGHSSHGYPSVAHQPGYQQGPASFSSHSAQEHSATQGYQYNNAGSAAYQAQPSSHRYQGGGLLQTQYNDGTRSPAYGHISGYGATASVSMGCLFRWLINTLLFSHFRLLLQGAINCGEFPLPTKRASEPYFCTL